MARFKNVDGTRIQLSPQEELEVDEREAAWEASADVRAAEEVREKRNAALAVTDYVGLSDYPVKAGELEYRQALRDVPQQAGFPNTHTWPIKP